MAVKEWVKYNIKMHDKKAGVQCIEIWISNS